ncbi:putative quinol monooxygenase [uncultured Lactobacillus sp.]|uniref:putative quinol monooxygenase n=1 Tax=uncultured Lactobacillus sp. TaxID=153152 RepID=UPI002803A1A2|nr:putative quinol monooxygenase [uncultured Lactobacillus sp.]
MSLTMILTYTGKNGAAQKYAKEMVSSGIVDRIRQQPGNLRYEYFQPLDDPESIVLIDTWKDQAALDADHDSPMMKELAQLRDKYDLHMKAERYVSEELPDQDKGFLRK